MKLNACNKHREANEAILKKLIVKGWTVDRFGHAKKIVDGTSYRYKFQHHTIRKEVQIIHAATKYSPASKQWARLSTLNYT